MATDIILKADKQKQIEDLEKERNKIQSIKDKASQLLDQYEDQLNPRVFELAKENIEKKAEESEYRAQAVTNGGITFFLGSCNFQIFIVFHICPP